MVHEHLTISVSAPQTPYIVEAAVTNASGGVYMLQAMYSVRHQPQFWTSRAIAWDENPAQALSRLSTLQDVEVTSQARTSIFE